MFIYVEILLPLPSKEHINFMYLKLNFIYKFTGVKIRRCMNLH